MADQDEPTADEALAARRAMVEHFTRNPQFNEMSKMTAEFVMSAATDADMPPIGAIWVSAWTTFLLVANQSRPDRIVEATNDTWEVMEHMRDTILSEIENIRAARTAQEMSFTANVPDCGHA